MPTQEEPLGASIIRALHLNDSDINKFILSALEHEIDKIHNFIIYARFDDARCKSGSSIGGVAGGEVEGGTPVAHADQKHYCCKFMGASLSRPVDNKFSIKAAVPLVGDIEITGRLSIDPQIANTPPAPGPETTGRLPRPLY
jgi:hypothetical protein